MTFETNAPSRRISARAIRLAATALGAGAMLASGTATLADVEQRTGTFAGLEVRYRVLLPDDYDPAATYPVVLHFAGGPQTWRIVVASTEADWREHAEARGIVVVSPAAPDGQLFFQGGDRIFPEFIEHILATFPAEGGKLHVTGHSNGGLSAFHVAALYPERFHSLTGYPGLFRRMSESDVARLGALCIFMHVGDRDPGWREPMEQQFRLLESRGLDVQFAVERDQTHRLDTGRDDLARRLFDQIDASRGGCTRRP